MPIIKTDCENNLTIDLTEEVGSYQVLHLTPWSSGVVCTCNTNDETHKLSFNEDLGIPLWMILNTAPAQLWVKDIPQPVLDALLKYEQYANYSAYSIMTIASHSNYLTELLIDTPLIIWMITRTAIQQNWTPEQVIHLSTDKRKNILQQLGFDASNATFKNLSKLNIKYFDERLYIELNNIDWKIVNPALNHLDTIDFKLVRFLNQNPDYVKWSLISSYDGWNWSTFEHYFRDTERLLLRIHQIRRHHINLTEPTNLDPSEQIKKCRSLNELIELHDRLAEELNDFEDAQAQKIIFPEPPFKGTDDIQPIRNLSELKLEGKSQKHCILSYQDRILNLEYYAYRVTQPERATLGIRRTREGRWMIDQLKLACNQRPSKETQEYVGRWLSH